MKNKIVLIVAVLVVGIGAGLGGYFMSGGGAESEPEIGAASAEPEPEIEYIELTPEFIVNFDQPSRTQYLMLDVTLATRDIVVKEIIEKHAPQIRNDLLRLFSQHANEKLFSDEGKAGLRDLAAQTVTEILKSHHETGELTDLFFTRFVMQ